MKQDGSEFLPEYIKKLIEISGGIGFESMRKQSKIDEPQLTIKNLED